MSCPNIMIDAEAWRHRRDRSRLCASGLHRPTRNPDQSRHRRADGAARRTGSYDPATGRYTLYAGSGGIVRQKRELAAILGVPEEAVRVIAREIGGNFGTRNSFFPEFALVAWGFTLLGGR